MFRRFQLVSVSKGIAAPFYWSFDSRNSQCNQTSKSLKGSLLKRGSRDANDADATKHKHSAWNQEFVEGEKEQRQSGFMCL